MEQRGWILLGLEEAPSTWIPPLSNHKSNPGSWLV